MIIPRLRVQSDSSIVIYHFTPKASAESPVLVMCHPTGFSAGLYSSVVSHLRNMNVYGIDFRSHGLSGRAPTDDWSGFQRDVNAAFTEIKHHSGATQFVGVGISSGSSSHILNAQEHPDLYIGLILCEPIMFPPGADLSHREMLATSARKRRSDFTSRNDVYKHFKDRGGLSHLSPSALALYSLYCFEEQGDHVTLRCKKEDEEAIYLSGAANGVFEALDSICVPTVIVYGETSDTVNCTFAELISSHIPGSRVEELHGTGHFTLFEDPLAGAALITRFMTSDLDYVPVEE